MTSSAIHFQNAVPLVLIGAGNMGGALLDGWLGKGMAADKIVVVDPGLSDDRRSHWGGKGVTLADTASGHLDRARTLVLAVKPQLMGGLLSDLLGKVSGTSLVVSVAAGTPVSTFEAKFGFEQPIVRAMPNTPAMIGEGMSVGFANGHVSDDQKAAAHALMASVGSVAWIDDEGLLDAVTGVSGSGPAYVFHMVEALAAAGEAAGLPDALAWQLARQTVIGGGAMLERLDQSASELRENVTSPNGTTAAALEVLMGADGFTDVLTRGVAAATARSRELAK